MSHSSSMAFPVPPPANFVIPDIFNRYKDRILGVIRKWCRSREDFEDILQNVFLKLYSTMARFQGRSTMDTWLYRIVVNECIDFYRRNRRFHDGRVDIDSVKLANSARNPEKKLEHSEMTRAIVEIVDNLKDKDRSVFALYFFCELDVHEISTQLKVSKNAVRCKIYQAKQKVIAECRAKGLSPSSTGE